MGYGVEYQFEPNGQWYIRREFTNLPLEDAQDVLRQLRHRADLHAVRLLDKAGNVIDDPVKED